MRLPLTVRLFCVRQTLNVLKLPCKARIRQRAAVQVDHHRFDGGGVRFGGERAWGMAATPRVETRVCHAQCVSTHYQTGERTVGQPGFSRFFLPDTDFNRQVCFNRFASKPVSA